MEKYLSSPERAEQKGRVEDGPLDLKTKFTEWPNMGDQGGGSKSKAKATGKASKTAVKSAAKSTGAKSSGGGRSASAPSSGGKSSGGGGSKGK